MNNSKNLKHTIVLILLVVLLFSYDSYRKNIRTKNKSTNTNKNMSNNSNSIKNEYFSNMEDVVYKKLQETAVPIKKEEDVKPILGNLEQCQEKCNLDSECIGFVREKKLDETVAKCHIIKNVINCHNEHKKPSDKYILNDPKIDDELEVVPRDFFKYDTYFKYDSNSAKNKDNIQKCITLEQNISIIPNNFPFSYLIVDKNNNLFVVNKKNIVSDINNISDEGEILEEKHHSKKGVFTIVKGLNGTGVSFKTQTKNGDFYICHRGNEENLVVDLYDDSLVFRESASFEIDMKYTEDKIKKFSEVRYVSIRKTKNSIDSFWKLNNVTKKIIIADTKELDESKTSTVMFELVSPLNFIDDTSIEKDNSQEEVSPAPSHVEHVEVPSKEEMNTELEQLEIDIRSAQHEQNLKLMNIMLDVNKFKLHDLSMVNYLTKCTGTSGEELQSGVDKPTYINTKIEEMNNHSNNRNNSNINNSNINNSNINNSNINNSNTNNINSNNL